MPRLALLLAGLLLVLPAGGTSAQEMPSASDFAEELVARERVRAAVAEAMRLGTLPFDDPEELRNNTISATDLLLAIGPDVVPYLSNELDQELIPTFFFAALALSHFDTPESEAALRKAMERASDRPGDFAFARKGWAGYCLAWMGRADVIDLLGEGLHQAGHGKLFDGCPIIEASAYLTAPASVPLLLGQLDRYYESETMMPERIYTIRSLGRIADPATAPRLMRIAKEPFTGMRREALHALGAIGTPEVVPVLVAALDDPDDRIRKSAAAELEKLSPEGILDEVRQRLEIERNTIVRGSLYRLLMLLGGVDELETLRLYADRKETDDRMYLVDAASMLGSDEALDILAAGIADPSTNVVLYAINGLTRLGTPEAVDLVIPALAARQWAIVQTAARSLAAIDAKPAAPMLAERIAKAEMSQVVTDPHIRERIITLGQVLVDLEYHAEIDALREAAARQRDHVLIQFLERMFAQMELLKRNGRRTSRWIEAISSSADGARPLAIRQLGRIGGARAAKALADSFDDASIEDGESILRELGGIDSIASRELFRRLLTSPEFDPLERLRQRELAAWGARRLGGEEQLEALRTAVVRRKGRDVRVMIYLALLGGESALPTLEEFRLSRWRFAFPKIGGHQKKLDWITREIRAGRSIGKIDVAPGKIRFY